MFEFGWNSELDFECGLLMGVEMFLELDQLADTTIFENDYEGILIN
jgi:hypothetical protein